jgi:AcrR family transcriptional regulator
MARGDRTRQVVLDALLELVDRGATHLTVRDVASRAGVSPRTVHNHFAGVEEMLAAAAAVQAARHRHLLCEIPPRGPCVVRITALCRQRRTYFETMSPVLLAALARPPDGPALGAVLDADRVRQCRQLADTLAPELRRNGAVVTTVLDALGFSTGWDAWRSLRYTNRFSAPGAERIMALMTYRIVHTGP